MPSETMDSSSFFSKELSFLDERQLGYWNTDGTSNGYGAKADGALSPYISNPLKGVQGNSLIANGFEHTDSDLRRYQRADPRLDSFSSTLENASNLSLLRGLEQNLGSASYFNEGDKVQFSRALNGNDPFLSSLPELYSHRLRNSSNNIHSGPPVGADEQHDEKESFESLQELEAQTIGNLLPDDDELFYGVADTIDCKDRLSRDVVLDEFFSNLQEDGQIKFEALEGDVNSLMRRSNSTTGMNYPICEYPSRTLFVRNIDSSIQDSELLALFGQYGDISSLQTTCKRQGFVMISYYDIRSACNAMKALKCEPIHQGNLDVHFSIPKGNLSDKDADQGTIVAFNVESSTSNDELRQIFGVYGEIMEIRDTPQRSPHKLIDFYDVRAADAALRALNMIGNGDNNMKLGPSHPGSVNRPMQQFSSDMDQDHSGLYLQQRSISPGGITSTFDNGMFLGARFSGRPPLSPSVESAFQNGISPRIPSRSPSPYLTNVDSVGNHSNSMEGSNPHGQLKYDIWGTSDSPSRLLPDYQDRFANGATCKSPGNRTVGHIARPSDPQENQFCRISPRGQPVDWNETAFSSSGNGNCLSPGQQYAWNKSPRPQPQGLMWPNSPSFVNGTCSPRPQQMNTISRPQSPNPSGISMVSSPSGNSSLWERRRGYTAESQDMSAFNSGSLGGLNIPGTFPCVTEVIPNNMFVCNGGSPMDSAHSQNGQFPRQNQTFVMVSPRGQLSPLLSPFESPNERSRGRRSDGSLTPSDKKQFELDIDRIMNGEDKRTTLMIKNIPNKYTSKMLLSTIDEHHRGTYDFLYLPIDFKNKCNVGYSFINMIDPSFIVPLYQTFNGKKWEKFNSEKVASIAYARIQGKAALVNHFQNSSLMNEDKRCRPMLFNTDGPNAGDQVPFPLGANIRSKAKIKPSSSSENVQEVLPDSANEEEIAHANSCSDSSRDSD